MIQTTYDEFVELAQRGTFVPVTGLTKIIRSRAVQAKNADNESRNRLTDDSANPLRTNVTSVRDTSRLVTAPTDNAANAVGISRFNAASEPYVFADTECWRSSSQTGSSDRTVGLQARGSTPPAKAARSRASQA